MTWVDARRTTTFVRRGPRSSRSGNGCVRSSRRSRLSSGAPGEPGPRSCVEGGVVAEPAAVLSILVQANTAQATTGLTKLNSQLGATSKQANQTATQMKSLAKGAAIGAATAAAYKAVGAFVDFDRSMRNVNSIARLSEKNFDSLSKRVLKLAGPTAQAPKTLADGL